MGRINKWITLTLIFFNIGFLLLANEPIIPNQIPRTEKGLENIYVQRLFEGQKDDSALEDSEYWVETTRKIHFFLDKQEKLPPNKYLSLLGSWVLVDNNKKRAKGEEGFFLANKISIITLQNKLSFSNMSSTTNIVKSDSGQLYFITRWLGGIRQIRFLEDKMFIYILNGDFWELDSIHCGGKYFFIKEDDI